VITAVDTNILLDVLAPDPRFGPASATALRWAVGKGSLIACEIVWAEVAARFEHPDDAARAFEQLTVAYSCSEMAEALQAGQAWSDYRRRGGTRQRVIADFLIGAHARARADRLLTRDRGFFRSYFADLTVVDPSAG